MWALLAVGMGGALGAMARFGISKIPALSSHIFPWMTLAANLIGALIVGFLAGAMMGSNKLSPNALAFLKTGFCGGLTTFSTFSVEAIVLFDNGHWGIGCIYIITSIILCLAGVLASRAIAIHLFA